MARRAEPLTDEQKSLRARIAVHTSWANTNDRTARTAPARAAALAKFEKQVDPDGILPEKIRKQRAESARKAHLLRLSMLGVEARARKRAS